MSIEHTTEMDENGQSKTVSPSVQQNDTQGHAHDREGAPFAGSGNRIPPAESKPDPTEIERGVDIDRSPQPDARDEQKVPKLTAPDWRQELPMPSSQNAVNTLDQQEPGAVRESELEVAQKQESKPKRQRRKSKK